MLLALDEACAEACAEAPALTAATAAALNTSSCGFMMGEDSSTGGDELMLLAWEEDVTAVASGMDGGRFVPRE